VLDYQSLAPAVHDVFHSLSDI
jgi:hypothetical protein